MILNYKNRKFIDKDYLNFIRKLPCCVTGKCGVDAHHVAFKGMGGITNDYYVVPLLNAIHVSQRGHINTSELEKLVKEPSHDLIMFYHTIYIRFITGKYDLLTDCESGWMEYRRMKGN